MRQDWPWKVVVIAAVIVYAGYRVVQYRKYKKYRVVPRVQVEELAARLASESRRKLLIVDVRSHGYYDRGVERIKGSIRIEPNNLEEEIKTSPKTRTFISTVLERAKRLAPGWRIYCGKKDSTRS